ncbi:MAG: hypothetical protein AVDCRST_MAG08-2466 [uncultured Acetobacteraceae bacterium]|uniref:Uncharacterized protein n=1 Tax=uncultured Acetobacteraceae bacterium TaxID=169975 RepID=A0A6J4ISF7_9PROT|nr:MAG: hypothetical protein AVDCRST_MAG08-2466 [uncultured Acetobacteraceae bacterium]
MLHGRHGARLVWVALPLAGVLAARATRSPSAVGALSWTA